MQIMSVGQLLHKLAFMYSAVKAGFSPPYTLSVGPVCISVRSSCIEQVRLLCRLLTVDFATLRSPTFLYAIKLWGVDAATVIFGALSDSNWSSRVFEQALFDASNGSVTYYALACFHSIEGRANLSEYFSDEGNIETLQNLFAAYCEYDCLRVFIEDYFAGKQKL